MNSQQARVGSGLYIMLFSVHGLLRGSDMELGRDADTGGQIQYVVELAKALSNHPRIRKVDLVTRLIRAKGVDDSYAQPFERLTEKAQIVRIPFGPRRYLRKENLWPHLFALVDGAIAYLRQSGETPDIIHGHYADGGNAGAHLAKILGVPYIFTGHSLGRVKRLRLSEKSRSLENLDKRFNFPGRIEAEETSLDTASLVVVSSHQEIEEQYALYDHYDSSRMRVIPPGLDLTRFRAPNAAEGWPQYFEELKKFLRHPEKPMVLAIARPDERKNLATLVRAFGEAEELREMANLAIVSGNRESLEKLDPPSRKVLRNLMVLIDRYDLYGIAAYPKKHTPENIPELYQIAAKTGGVFVNPALTEPFGLTLIEAAASGLPVVATNDGGPRDIIDTCKHGVLIDPHDASALGEALANAISNRPRWKKWSQNARTRALQEYTWEGHVTKYISELEELHFHRELPRSHYPKGNLTKFNRLLVTHIRGIFQGEDRARQELIDLIQSNRENLGICVSTRLNREEALQKIDEIDGPRPDFLICSSGSEIFSGPELVVDKSWEKQIDFRWDREQIKELVRSLPDLSIDESEQRYFRITLSADANSTTMRKDIRKLLRQHNLYANVVYSYDHLFDILPIRATTGHALRHVSLKWGIPAKAIIVCRYQTGDESMLLGSSQGVVLGVPDSLTEQLRGSPHIFFARQSGASGVLAGIRHFQFLSSFTEHETYL